MNTDLRPFARLLSGCLLLLLAGCRSVEEPEFVMGARAYEAGNISEAIEHYRAAIDRDFGNYRAHFNLGSIYHELWEKRRTDDPDAAGRFAELALASYDEVLRRRPSSPRTLSNKALLLDGLGRGEEAMAMLQAAMATGHDSEDGAAIPFYTAGRMRDRTGDPAGAEAFYREGLERDPVHDLSLYALSALLLSAPAESLTEERLSDMLKRLDTGLATHATDALLRVNRARLLGIESGRLRAAGDEAGARDATTRSVEDLEMAASLDPRRAAIQDALSAAHCALAEAGGPEARRHGELALFHLWKTRWILDDATLPADPADRAAVDRAALDRREAVLLRLLLGFSGGP